jgi:hypothetical protein
MEGGEGEGRVVWKGMKGREERRGRKRTSKE